MAAHAEDELAVGARCCAQARSPVFVMRVTSKEVRASLNVPFEVVVVVQYCANLVGGCFCQCRR